MSAPLNIQPNPGASDSGVASIDSQGNETINGNLVLKNGAVVLGKMASAPGQVPGAVQLYTTDGTTIASVASGGQPVNQTVSGNLTVSGNIGLGPVTSPPASPAVGLDLYTTDGITLGLVASGGHSARLQVPGNMFTNNNVIVNSLSTLGDNGVGEIQLAAASTVPTVAPTGGGDIYATNTGGLIFFDQNGQYNPLIAGAQTSATTAGALAETMHVYTASASQSPVSTTLYIQKIFLAAGQTVGRLSFVTSTTAATGPTHWWMALLDNTYKQQAHTADQLTAAIPASTWQKLTVVTPYTATYSGAYYLAFMIAATTPPTIAASPVSPLAVFVTGTGAPTPLPNGASTSGLTVPGTDGTTVYAAPTAASAPFYMYCAQ